MNKLDAINKARYLRKEKTKAEKILWEELRNRKLGIKFRRQHPLAQFILDFYAPSINLAIELDGRDHVQNREYDTLRTMYLETKRLHVIRFWNKEIENNLSLVIGKIKEEIKSLTHSSPLQNQ
mgnify:CR=1 FL=1